MPPRPTSRALVGLLLALVLAALAGTTIGAATASAQADPYGSRRDFGPTDATAPRIPAVTFAAPAEVFEAVAESVGESYWAAVEAAVAADRAAKARDTAARAASAAAAQARAAAMSTAPAGSIDNIIQRHFGAVAGQARAIAACESNLNPGARSPTNDHGLFQINIVHRDQFAAVTGHPWSAVYDAEINARYAKWLYDREGWRPWTCRKVL